jgi:hypothetical protein
MRSEAMQSNATHSNAKHKNRVWSARAEHIFILILEAPQFCKIVANNNDERSELCFVRFEIVCV